jgi:hypothetical protein
MKTSLNPTYDRTGPAPIPGSVSLSRQGNGICRGTAQLTNGDTYAFSVEFRASGNGCCGSLAYPIDASAAALIDAGGAPSP